MLSENEYQNATYIYVKAFVDEIYNSGVEDVVICPGSRSTPLALVMTQSIMRTWMHVDERSAAFFALGIAKLSGKPVALVCTSGTAAANFLPAIVEAKLTHVPLLVITSDRPHELRDNGAPQAIDQIRLYGTHVKWFVDAALPEATNEALRYIRTLACRSTALTMEVPVGPVHVNMPFREPLTPEPIQSQPLLPPEQRDPVAWNGRPNRVAYVAVEAPESYSYRIPLMSTAYSVASQISQSPHGLIIAGPYQTVSLNTLEGLSDLTAYPILADPLSQLRTEKSWSNYVISSYDAFLRVESFIEQNPPDIIIRLGAMPISKPLLLYLKRYSTCKQIVIDKHGGWEEPTQLASMMIHANPVTICNNLIKALQNSSDHIPLPPERLRWQQVWSDTDELTRQTLQKAINDFEEPFEGRVFTELAQILPQESTLYVGNSMPIRDMDTFFWKRASSIRCIGNRGANGIDGVISSALGASVASGSDAPTVLVIGDLSFYHDLNGLLAAKMHQLDLTIILVNNDGGGIFSFLPQAAYLARQGETELYEEIFGTPTGLDFRPVVEMYGGTFERPTTWEQFREAVQHGMSKGGLHVVEVRTERESNVKMHRQLWQAVKDALSAS